MLLNGANVENRQSELEDQASLGISQLIILLGPSTSPLHRFKITIINKKRISCEPFLQ